MDLFSLFKNKLEKVSCKEDNLVTYIVKNPELRPVFLESNTVDYVLSLIFIFFIYGTDIYIKCLICARDCVAPQDTIMKITTKDFPSWSFHSGRAERHSKIKMMQTRR